MTLLKVEDLQIHFSSEGASVHAVNGVTFSVKPGEAVAIVGESGCGKTVTALSLLGLLPQKTAHITGKIDFEGESLHRLTSEDWRGVRGNKISMIFQDPGTALNPTMRVGRQISETLRQHQELSRSEAKQRARSGLAAVGIDPDDERKYPHQMSGGQRQRVMIAIAVACEPQLLIADEPTTALDVTTQAQIVELVKAISTEMAVLWITHDLALAATLVDRVLVMYAGQIVEEAPVDRLFAHPAHPYTRALLAALPSLNSVRGRPLIPIEGAPPSLTAPPVGCSFYERCGFRADSCRTTMPEPERVATGHYASCLRMGHVERSSTS